MYCTVRSGVLVSVLKQSLGRHTRTVRVAGWSFRVVTGIAFDPAKMLTVVLLLTLPKLPYTDIVARCQRTNVSIKICGYQQAHPPQ